MIGLAGLHDGCYTLQHPAGALFLRVRRRRIVHAELAPWGAPKTVSWSAGPRERASAILEGYRALAERVVTGNVDEA